MGNHWMILLVPLLQILAPLFVKLLYSVCMSKYRWHWEIMKPV